MVSVGKVLPRGQVTLPRAIRQEAGFEPGDTITFRATGPGRIEVEILPTMTMAEIWERFPIEGEIDEAADRELWEAEAAKEVIGA